MNPENEWLKLKTEVFHKAQSAKAEAESTKKAADDAFNNAFSDQYTKFYTRNMEHFKGAKKSGESLSNQEAINTAWEFMKKRWVQIQELFNNTDITKEVRKSQIQAWRDEFIREQQIQLQPKTIQNPVQKVEPTATVDAIPIPSNATGTDDEDIEDAQLEEKYENAQRAREVAVVQLDQAHQEYVGAVRDYDDAKKEWIDDQQQNAPLVSNRIEDALETHGRTKPFDIDSPEGQSQIAQIGLGFATEVSVDQGWYSEKMTIIHATDGSYILRTQDGWEMMCSWDPDELRYMVQLFKECSQTPLVRRMMNMWDTAFDQVRARVIAKNPNIPSIATSPDRLIRQILTELTHIAAGWKDEIDRWNGQKVSIGDILWGTDEPINLIQRRLVDTSNGMRDALSHNLAGIFDPMSRRFSFDTLIRKI